MKITDKKIKETLECFDDELRAWFDKYDPGNNEEEFEIFFEQLETTLKESKTFSSFDGFSICDEFYRENDSWYPNAELVAICHKIGQKITSRKRVQIRIKMV